MHLTLAAPFFYLLIGFVFGHTKIDIKRLTSSFLSRIVIPFVIVYNILTCNLDLLVVIFATAIMMFILLFVSRFFTSDPVRNLCFCYLNIGWLGLPIATALFGNGAATLIIACYVGSSLFGNSVGAGLMAGSGNFRSRMKQVLQAPPVWALMLGLICIPFGNALEHGLKPLYEVMKFLMSFLGMAILGIWLAQTPVRKSDFQAELLPFVLRSLCIFILVSLFVSFSYHNNVTLVNNNYYALYLLCLLPPAANIIVLETHYLRTGRSAAMIAASTCISIVAITLYVSSMHVLDHH